jgi:hypothetical protein
MLWVNKEDKRCKTAEDLNFFPGEDGINMRYRELRIADSRPVICVGTYERRIPYFKYNDFGRFYCVGMGLASTKGKGGMRHTIINALN